MRKLVGLSMLALMIASVTPIVAAAAGGGQTACPAGTPASPKPAPDFVPTPDCMGWVPATHPLAGPGVSPPPPATATCTLQTLRGAFVFSASGFNIVGGVPQPKAIVETIEFNGDGTLFVPAATVSLNGVIIRSPPSSGTYVVAEDCTGTIAFNGPTYDMFLSKGGESISMIQTNLNTVFQGVATRMSK